MALKAGQDADQTFTGFFQQLFAAYHGKVFLRGGMKTNKGLFSGFALQVVTQFARFDHNTVVFRNLYKVLQFIKIIAQRK